MFNGLHGDEDESYDDEDDDSFDDNEDDTT